MSAAPNPLLSMLDSGELPPFKKIKPEHAAPAIDTLLADARATVTHSTAANTATWDSLIAPIEAAGDRLARAFAPVSHLHSVMDSPEWRSAYQACLPKLTDFQTEMGQNTALFEAYQNLANSDEYPRLEDVQRKIIDDALRDFRLSGVALNTADKARYKETMQRLSALSTDFQQHLLDATQAWSKLIKDESDLAGLPESAVALLAQNARNKDQTGWLLTLDAPSFMAVISHADSRELRREIYAAYTTRASDQGPQAGEFDNSAVMEEILALRHEAAALVGFDNYADYSLATKMADSCEQVEGFLIDLAQRSKPMAHTELEALADYAKTQDGIDELQAWDIGYYSEKLKQARYQLADEDLKPYFPAPRVIVGLFAVVERLYGLHIRALDGVQTWHEDVTVYEIKDAQEQLRGRFFLDPYARENKRGGAWMDDCQARRRTQAGVQTPVAFLTCNFSPPIDDKPALLTHDEVTTLFHEFGHGLHHMLTQIDYADISGINGVEWDAVELPSQFMENWCWERASLDLFAHHYATGEPLPSELFDRLNATRNYMAGWDMLRQVQFSLFDLRLHRDYDPAQGARIEETLTQVREIASVLSPPDWNRFAHGFGHIFAGGYAAGYYGYKWAEVLSADAFSAFEETDLFDTDTGQRFLNEILERGGSRPAMEAFKAFRGREPQIDALLRHCGLECKAA